MKFYGQGKIKTEFSIHPLGKFKSGMYETNDPEMIKTMKDLGYKHEPEKKKEEKVIKKGFKPFGGKEDE